MTIRSWIRKLFTRPPRTVRRAPTRFRPTLEALEDRVVPALFTVNTLADTVDADPDVTSLREAITAANTLAGDDTIQFSVTGTINLARALPELSSNIAIEGPGADSLTIRRNIADQIRIFRVSAGATVDLSGLTIADGHAANGGGINNQGTLTVSDILFSNNRSGDGGAIFNVGTLTVINSTFTGNTAARGGAIDNEGMLTVSGSTFTANAAVFGAGLYNEQGTMTVINSTVSGNIITPSKFEDGEGLYNISGTVTITNCTFSENTGEFTLLVNLDKMTLNNTIVDGLLDNKETGTLTGSNNLIASGNGLQDLTGTITGDANLGELADNGGPTWTRALLTGSAAINAGSNALAVDQNGNSLTTDQRGTGFDRTVGTVDLGAFEVQGPTDIALSNSSIVENEPSGTVVGTFSTTDPDTDDTFTYSLVSGDTTAFTIEGNQLKTAASFDFEAKSSYTIRVQSTDATGLSFEKDFTISVTDVNENEAPTDIALSITSVAENEPAGTVVGTFSTTDPDTDDTFTYSLVSGDTTAFAIDGDELKTAAGFDFESKSSYTIRVQTTDAGGLSTEKDFTISVTNVNETPTDIALSNGSIAENEPAGMVVGTFSSTDPDTDDTFTYSLVSGDTTAFAIDGDELKTAAGFDFESQSSFTIRVQSTDAGGLSVEKDFTISVADVNEAPLLLVPPAQTAYEDMDLVFPAATTGTVTGGAGAGKADGFIVDDPEGDNLTLTVSAGHGTLTLGRITGLTFTTGDGTADATMTFTGSRFDLNAALASLIYRGNLNYSGTDTLSITASDGSLSTSGSVAITVKSASQQAASLKAQVTDLRDGGFLTSRQASSLLSDLSLKGNSGDAGKVGSFLNTVEGLRKSGVLTQDQADALLGPGNTLLLSVTRR